MKLKNYAEKYAYTVEFDSEDNIYIARCAELPSLAAHGKTSLLAIAEIQKVVEMTLKWMEDEGQEIPEPYSIHQFSGEFRVRMPPEKHRRIAIEANLQGISMNQYIVSKL